MKTDNYLSSVEPTKKWTFLFKRENEVRWNIFMHYFATAEDAEETIAYCQMSPDYETTTFVLMEVDMQPVKEV